MSLYGKTKGTELEQEIERYAQGECQGVGMYYALACLAQEKGLDDLAGELRRLGNEEAKHAGLYMVLNGKIPEDIFAVMSQTAQIETSALGRIKEFAQRVRTAGLEDAAREIDKAAEEEGGHGEVLNELLKKYSNN